MDRVLDAATGISTSTALSILTGCIILLNIIVASIRVLFPGKNEGLWTPCSEDRRNITEIKDNSTRPFISTILGLLCIGLVEGDLGEDATKPRQCNKMV